MRVTLTRRFAPPSPRGPRGRGTHARSRARIQNGHESALRLLSRPEPPVTIGSGFFITAGRRVAMTQKLLKIVLVLCVLTPASWAQDAAHPGTQQIDVATINLYVGADFSPVLSLDPSDPDYPAKLVAGVATIYA